VTAPYTFGIHQDNKDSTKYVADLYQDGLGLPDRDYYLKADDAKLADTLAKYELHVGKMLTLAGDATAPPPPTLVEFEKELAKLQWTKVELRDPIKAYNKVDIAKLGEVAPGYDWNAYLTDAGVAGKVSYVIVSQPSYLKGMTALLEAPRWTP
jgi:predicted metalloendopeptidase